MTARAAPRPVIDVMPAPKAIAGPPGGDASAWLILAVNESQFGSSSTIAAAVAAQATSANRYADPAATALRNAIGAAHDIDPQMIVCGNGSEDVIDNLVRAFLRAGDEVLGPAMTWAGFAASANRQGATLVEAPNRQDWTADIDAILARVTPRTKMVFVANPHNPFGVLTPAAEIRRLVAALPSHIVLCLDAAYAELVTDPAYSAGHEFVSASPNIVVTRTFSKVYGLAGARCGWIHAPKPVCDALNAMRQMSVVPALVEAAAIAGLADQAWIREVASRNAAVRAKLSAELTGLRLEFLPSQTNFVTLRIDPNSGRTADEVHASLYADGIVVSKLAPYKMPEWLRITLPTESDLARIVSALAKALGRNA